MKRKSIRRGKELLLIAGGLLSRNKDSNAAKFILKIAGKVTFFAELTKKMNTDS